MVSIRPLVLSLLALPIAACAGDDGVTAPSGPHYTYVANTLSVPINNTQAREYGLDLNNDKMPDNQLGMVLGTLSGQGFDVQGAIDTSIADGSIILLVDFQTNSFTSTTGAGLSIKLGDDATAMPAPCTDPTMPATCGQHLKGTGTFTVAADSPQNVALAGRIAGGTYSGGPGDISLQIALAGSAITLDLIGARAKATGITETGMTSLILAGALSKDDLDNKVIPALHMQIEPIIAEDCTGTAPPEPCGCVDTGKTIIGLFDTTPKDCMVSIDEIRTNTLIMSLLAPDVEINGVPALSLGIKATTVGATFPTPAE